MKRIDAAQLNALLQGAKTIEEDGLGVKVARLEDGDFLKLYRRKRLLSSDLWNLPAQRFATNAQGLLRLGIAAPKVLDVLIINQCRLSAVRYQPLPGDTLRNQLGQLDTCLLYTSPSPRDATLSRMPSSA